MLNDDNKTAQAALELAIFGAILIFILGSIVRAAIGNSYGQNENFKAMRMALLASWKGTESATGPGALANISHNNASILIVEDRLSPDYSKYGDIDRNPYVAQGSGTFTYNLDYPWQPGIDDPSHLVPIMDIWINGQHFPMTTAQFRANVPITRTACGSDGPYTTYPLTPAQCIQNQCLRNAREWAGGTVTAGQFNAIVPVSGFSTATGASMTQFGQDIFTALKNLNIIGSLPAAQDPWTGVVLPGLPSLPSNFTINDPNVGTVALSQAQINAVQNILNAARGQYKLFFTRVPNGIPQFNPDPPGDCSGPNNALCSSMVLPAISCPAGINPSNGTCSNQNGDMQYDLNRNGDYAAVDTQFPPGGPLRGYIGWQWAASPATSASAIGLDTGSNQFPTYDIDGRLKEVTVYGLTQNRDGTPVVTFEDLQNGDIDSSWDINSCGPKPGLQTNMQIFTFTMQGTYLEIREGKLYNPENDAFVRNITKRDTIDLIQRVIQLSNNTGDFCNGAAPQAVVNGSPDRNPVEVCVAQNSQDTCFSNANITRTCFDANDNRMFVRTRLLDQRGHAWITDTQGKLQVQ